MTVTVTGFTADRMLEMEDATVISGHLDGDDLILVTKGGDEVNAGNVRGIQGIPGPGYIICTSSTHPSSPTAGTPIYETDTKLTRIWNGTKWRCQERFVCTSSTRPTLVSVDEGVKIYETDTDRELIWSGSAWVSPAPRGLKVQRQRVGDQSPVTGAATVVTGYSVTLAVEASRVYEVVLTPRVVGVDDGDQGTVRMQVDGTNYGGAMSVTCTISGRGYGGTMVWLLNGLSAGNKAITISLQKNNGTGVYTADGGEISVRDIGGT